MVVDVDVWKYDGASMLRRVGRESHLHVRT
jgi:hypothetical protein